MISASGLSVIFGDRALFKDVSFFISEKDTVGLVGKNGAGKSTLLKLIAGEENPTSGDISLPKECTVGYLPQDLALNPTLSVFEEASKAFDAINKLEERSQAISSELAEREDYESEGYLKLIEDLNHINDRLTILDAGNMAEHVSRILKGLGFSKEELDKPLSTFSGGWQMRVELGKLLLQKPDVLLLDEPTNHLDILSIQWLETFLKSYPGAVILISHDKAFLDNLTNRTMEIANSSIYDYKASYTKYLVLREAEKEKQIQAYKNQQKYIEDTQRLIEKFRAKKNKAAFAQTLIRKLEKLERIEIDDINRQSFKLVFPPAPRSGKVIFRAEKLSKSYGDKTVFGNLDMIVPRGEKIAVVGKNGVGKTTLMKILVDEIDYSGELEIGHNVNVGFYAQHQTETLDGSKTVFDTIDEEAVGDMRTKVRGLLGAFLFSGDDVDKKVKVLSGGEKARLALCKLLLQPYNVLVLDEPTNHLDIASKEVLKQALKDYDGTVILVSHDRDFLSGLVNTIYEVTSNGLKEHLGDIYEFLKTKDVESIAAFELRENKADPKAKSESKSKLSYDERKEMKRRKSRLENAIRKGEKKVSELEEALAEVSKELEQMDYSDSDSTGKGLEKYNELKAKLDSEMTDWENNQIELEQLVNDPDYPHSL